ncbi:hypothetical protein KBC04_02080 [Candidatus Babeliales bacterium]|nr:hypothetical protein [Candidatus Babeliales bacterium]MBP9843802.1 hypothetical protein [Candidatus Babeliales bacterium]
MEELKQAKTALLDAKRQLSAFNNSSFHLFLDEDVNKAQNTFDEVAKAIYLFEKIV